MPSCPTYWLSLIHILRFAKPGNYSIALTVDGELASRAPFRVVQVQEEAPQA